MRTDVPPVKSRPYFLSPSVMTMIHGMTITTTEMVNQSFVLPMKS